MRRNLFAIGAALAVAAASLTVGIAPVSAASAVEVNEVSLAASSDCASAQLELNLTSATADTEAGLATTLDDLVLSTFKHPSTIAPIDGVTPYSYPFAAPAPDGTVIGLYGWLSEGEPTPETAGEWFVLYRCGDPSGPGAPSEVLQVCYGPLGSCPTTAPEAQAQLFNVIANPWLTHPGTPVTVTATDCFAPLAGVALRAEDDTVLAVAGPGAPDADGAYAATLTIPASTTPGTTLLAWAGCGFEDTPMAEATMSILVLPDPTTSTTTTTAPASTTTTEVPSRTVVSPKFAG